VDAERALISKAVHTGQIERLISMGITEEHFLDPEVLDVWKFMCDHVRKYRSAPSIFVVRERFPSHQFEVVQDSLDYVRDRFIGWFKRRTSIELLHDLAAAVEDPDQIMDIEARFNEAARRLSQAVPSAEISRFSDMKKRIEEYERRKEAGEAHGIMMGIADFDELTLGMQPHEYVSIVGWQGTGKSTLAQWLMFNAYAQGHTPMYISLEMECEALFRKWDVMATQMEYQALKALNLSDDEKRKWEEMAERVAKAPNDIIAFDDVRGCTVDRVYADTVKYGPGLVCVDYLTLMQTHRSAGKDSSMWEKVTYLTQALKQNARTLKVPLIGVAQTNINSADEGAELQNISYSRSIGQDSDLVLGLHQSVKMKEQRQMQVRMLKNRDGATRTTELFWKMGTMEFGPWDETHLFTGPGAATK
jgi:replicative DNA helicase